MSTDENRERDGAFPGVLPLASAFLKARLSRTIIRCQAYYSGGMMPYAIARPSRLLGSADGAAGEGIEAVGNSAAFCF